MFTLVISCLTTSSLPWFMDLTFQAPVQCCYFSTGFTFTTRHIHNSVLFPLWLSLFILSGAISLLFPSSILDTYWPGGFIFQCHIFLPFHTVHGVLKARILQWFAILFFSGPHFVRTLHYDPSILDGPTTAWLIASLSYASPFTTVRLWSMKEQVIHINSEN